MIVGEVRPLESAVLALGLVEDRDVRLDPALLHQPGEHFRPSRRRCRRQAARAGGRSGPACVDHRARGADLGLTDRPRGLDVDDDSMVDIDQVVGGVGEEGCPFSAPVHRAAGSERRHELRLRPGSPRRRQHRRALSSFLNRIAASRPIAFQSTGSITPPSAACWHPPGSGSHQRRSLRRRPALPQCSGAPSSRTARARDRYHGSGHGGSSRRSNAPGQSPF